MVVVVGCIGGVGLICELWVQFMIYGYGFVSDVVLELDCVVVVVVVDFFFFFFLLLGFVVVAGGPMVEVVEVVVASGPTVEWVSMGCGWWWGWVDEVDYYIYFISLFILF